MKNILVVSVNWLGDAVFSTPVYRNLKEFYPNARITALAVPRVKPVLALCPYIDDIIIYDENGADRPLADKVRMIFNLRKRGFDGVYFLRPSLSRALLTMMAGIPVRVGFKTRNSWGAINRPVADDGLEGVHRSDNYLLVLERSGVTVRDRSCRLSVDGTGLAIADRILFSRGIGPQSPFIVLNTGGNWDLKQWPEERFAVLARRIVQEKKIDVVFTGASGDSDRVARIASLSGVKTADLTGATDMQAMAAVFHRARCVISADSGPLHLASALGVTTLAIFGPTRPEITGPRGMGRSVIIRKDVGCNKAPCYYLECMNNRCMKVVEVDDVFNAL